MNQNESTFDFNVRIKKGIYKAFQVMRLGEDICLTTYFDASDSRMPYIIRYKDPKTSRDVYKMAMNIENKKPTSGKLGRRDDPKLFNPRGNKKEGDKSIVTKKPKDDIMGQVLNLLKNLNPPAYHANKPNTHEKPQFNNNYNKKPTVKNYPYTTQWKHGKPIPNPSQGIKDKGTSNPLKINSINMMDDVPWCIVCQSPHSPNYCAIA